MMRLVRALGWWATLPAFLVGASLAAYLLGAASGRARRAGQEEAAQAREAELVEAVEVECCPPGAGGPGWREQGVDRAKVLRDAKAARGEFEAGFRCERCGREYRVRVLVLPHTGESGP